MTACPGLCVGSLNPTSEVTCIAGPPRSKQITERPAAIASSDTHPPESCRAGCNNTSHSASFARTSARGISPQKITLLSMASWAANAINRGFSAPSPMIQYSALGELLQNSANALMADIEPLQMKQRSDAGNAKGTAVPDCYRAQLFDFLGGQGNLRTKLHIAAAQPS